MNRLISTLLVSFVASAALASFTSMARADEGAPPAPATSTAVQDRATDSAPVKPFKSLAVEINPLAASIGRYSIQGEWLPVEHQALVLNPHLDHVSTNVGFGGGATISDSFTGFGTELGYRYYTGSRGANGFFVGPSVLVAHYSESAAGQSTSFNSIGGAVDVGGQFLIGPGVIVGFGVGLQYTKNSLNGSTDGLGFAASAIAGDGLRPRALLTVGYAF